MVNIFGLTAEVTEDGRVFLGKTCMFCSQKVDLGRYDEKQITELRKVLTNDDKVSSLVWMHPEYREMFISGMCPKCWKKTFSE